MNNIVFDVPLAANTHAEAHVLHVSRDKWLIKKKEIYCVCVKISFHNSFSVVKQQ